MKKKMQQYWHRICRIFVVVILLCCFSLSGCISADKVPEELSPSGSNSGSLLGESSHSKYRVQYFAMGAGATMYEGSMAISGLSFYDIADHLDPYSGDISLRVRLCSEPGCSHATSDCINVRFAEAQDCGIYQNRIIFTSHNRNDGSYGLYLIGLDGKDLKELKKWTGVSVLASDNAVMIDQYFYCFLIFNETAMDANGYVDVKSAVGELYRIDMNTGTVNVLYSTEMYYGVSAGHLFYSDGKLAFSMSAQQKSLADIGLSVEEYINLDAEKLQEIYKLLDHKRQVCIVDLTTGTASFRQINEEMSGEVLDLSGFWDGELLLSTNQKVYRMGLDQEQPKIWLEDSNPEINYKISQYSDFLMITKLMPDADFQYFVCLNDDFTGYALELPHEDKNISISYESPTMLHLIWEPQKLTNYSDEWTYELMSKETLFSWIKDSNEIE